MEGVKWTDRIRNLAVLEGVDEERGKGIGWVTVEKKLPSEGCTLSIGVMFCTLPRQLQTFSATGYHNKQFCVLDGLHDSRKKDSRKVKAVESSTEEVEGRYFLASDAPLKLSDIEETFEDTSNH
ncbi:hypothetical protein ANN_04420 [Periplaneta americana]|uniref:Uncharacterized protein n=1 Tax=Periplaneta americana TaxID=6978 RepID=A0ABQ8T8H6_PERAM|nr:hypothetical protein ANN_04420 [Periplaneta americana]